MEQFTRRLVWAVTDAVLVLLASRPARETDGERERERERGREKDTMKRGDEMQRTTKITRFGCSSQLAAQPDKEECSQMKLTM